MVLLLACAALADDAARLKGKAIVMGRKAEADWKRYVLERKTFTDADVKSLIATYEEVIELFYKSLEIQDDDSLNGQIVVIARRIAKLRFEQMRRRRAKEPTEPKPKPKTKPADKEPDKPEDKPTKPEPKEQPDDTPELGRGSEGGWPELEEDKKARKRGIQTLRNFIMHHYFASRKFSALVTRCSRCGGSGRIRIGRDPRTRKISWSDCPNCKRSGAHLKANMARRAFWLTMSPAYRGTPRNREDFFQDLAKWQADPRLLPEFLSSLAITSIDYRGLWAVVKLREKGTAMIKKKPRKFSRKTQLTFVRLGKRWFVYNESADKDWFG